MSWVCFNGLPAEQKSDNRFERGPMLVSHKKPENGMVKWSWSFSRGALTTSHFRVCYQAQIRDVNAEGAAKTDDVVERSCVVFG